MWTRSSPRRRTFPSAPTLRRTFGTASNSHPGKPADLLARRQHDPYPGMTDHYWRGDLMRINSADPGEPERLLRKFAEQR
jgi:hypothetical protein